LSGAGADLKKKLVLLFEWSDYTARDLKTILSVTKAMSSPQHCILT